MSTVKILTIGNSFSQDATRYLHEVAKAAGIDTKIWNLYIGGCPLEKHWANVVTDAKAYVLEINGVTTLNPDKKVSIDEAIAADEWDYISLQQASGFSGWINSYEPFMGLLVAHIREKAPNAKLLIHETWAYEITSTQDAFMRYNRNQQEMFERLHACYTEMAAKYSLDIIPCGEIIQQVRKLPAFDVANGGLSLCRDGFHMGFDYGRYLLACIWTKKLFGVSLKDNAFVPGYPWIPEDTDPELLKVLREAVDAAL